MLELAENPQRRQPKTYGPFFGMLLLPLLFIAAAASIPYVLIVNALYRAREKRFAKQMAEIGRTVSFSDCMQALDSAKGTLIREWKTTLTGPTRCWWTPDDLIAKSPSPIAARGTKARVVKAPRFTQWCFDEYINVSNGKAMLIVFEKQQRKLFREKLKSAAKIDVLTHTSEGW